MKRILESHKASISCFDGNYCHDAESADYGPSKYITDGHMLFPRSAVVAKERHLDQRHARDQMRHVLEQAAADVFTAGIEAATDTASLYADGETLEHKGGYTVVQFTAKTETVDIYSVFFDVEKLALCLAVTGADEIRTSSPKAVAVLYRDNEPVGLLMPVVVRDEDRPEAIDTEKEPEVYTPSTDKRDSYTYHDVTFPVWMSAVDAAVSRLVGLSVHDLADAMFRDAYDDGTTAYDMAIDALENDDIGVRALAEVS
jgi:hypothetical protein